jgi:hypothetical protein
LKPGRHKLQFRAEDEQGNSDPTPVKVAVKVVKKKRR